MPLLLDLIYLLLVVAGTPWFAYAAWRHGKYREGWAEQFLGRVPLRESDRPCIWFHAVSVGEVNLLRPLLDRVEHEFPGWDVVISTTTKTGFDLATKKYAGLPVFYCPRDFSWAVNEAVRRIRPELLVLAELELWPNMIRAAKSHGCRVAIFNGRLSEKSARRYEYVKAFIGRVLRQVDLIAVQSETYADRFRHLGARPETVFVTGSVKFDGAQTNRGNIATQRLRAVARFQADEVVFLAGSTQAPEEELAVETFRQLHGCFPNLRLVLVPRHITRCDEIEGMLSQTEFRWERRTALDDRLHDPEARILLVDTIGELGAWWGAADIAYVGGSLGSRGGQNMIEPAAYGAAVSFGPNTRNFRDIVSLLLANEAAVVVQDGQELTEFVRKCLLAPDWARSMGQRAQKLVVSQIGASDRTIALLSNLIRSTDGLSATRQSRQRAAPLKHSA